MIWQNPWAWAGLALLALPVLVHLLSRAPADVRQFPSLRFVESSRLPPRRRTRVRDIPLLLTRLAILGIAVAALAQPLVQTSGRGGGETRIARAVVLDTSASMQRALTNGSETVRDSARRLADASAREAARSVVVATGNVASALPGALAWLSAQPGMHELMVVSDFQRGTIDSSSLGAVPERYGVRLVRVAGPALDSSFTLRGASGTTSVRVTPLPYRTDMRWEQSAGPDSVPLASQLAPFTVSGSESERASAVAAMRAASGSSRGADLLGERYVTTLENASGGGRADTSRDVRILLPGFANRDELLARTVPPSKPWMSELLLTLRTHALLQDVARDARVVDALAGSSSASDSMGATEALSDSTRIVVARNSAGAPVVLAAQAASNQSLLLLSNADAGSLASAALMSAVQEALSSTGSVWEREPLTTSDVELARWSRMPRDSSSAIASTSTDGSPVDGGDSDARWLWAFALAMLGVEAWLRRRSGDALAEAS